MYKLVIKGIIKVVKKLCMRVHGKKVVKVRHINMVIEWCIKVVKISQNGNERHVIYQFSRKSNMIFFQSN